MAASIVIYGAGGHARELLFQIRADCGGSSIVAMVDDIAPHRTIYGVSVLHYEEALARYGSSLWFVAVGNILARTDLTAKIKKDGITPGTFISSTALVAPSARIRSSVQIFSGSVISDNCDVYENVIINFNCTISHDVKIGANSTIAPGVAIAGNVTIGEDVWVGVGASVTNGKVGQPLIIGDRVVIGAGACVIRDTPADQTVVGVPAQPIGR